MSTDAGRLAIEGGPPVRPSFLPFHRPSMGPEEEAEVGNGLPEGVGAGVGAGALGEIVVAEAVGDPAHRLPQHLDLGGLGEVHVRSLSPNVIGE